MQDNDAFRLIDRDVAVFWVCVLIGMVAVFVPSHAKSGELRAELNAGYCKHSLAPDASWHYDYGGYQQSMRLRPACWQLGALWKLDRNFGLRGAYVDLGDIVVENEYPLSDAAYFAAKDSGTAVASGKSSFQGRAHSRGFTLGPVLEYGHFSAEIGAAAFYNEWHVWAPPFAPSWSYADGWNTTWYVGTGMRWKWFTVNLRRYANVHASQASENLNYIGPTSGPVLQATIGVSVPL